VSLARRTCNNEHFANSVSARSQVALGAALQWIRLKCDFARAYRLLLRQLVRSVDLHLLSFHDFVIPVMYSLAQHRSCLCRIRYALCAERAKACMHGIVTTRLADDRVERSVRKCV
jgi:hypothetical protein